MLGLFNQVGLNSFPGRLDPCHIAVELEFDPAEANQDYPIHLRLIDEDGRTLTMWSGVYHVDNPSVPASIRSFLTIPFPWDRSLTIGSPGRYRLDVIVESPSGEETILGGEVLTVIGPTP